MNSHSGSHQKLYLQRNSCKTRRPEHELLVAVITSHAAFILTIKTSSSMHLNQPMQNLSNRPLMIVLAYLLYNSLHQDSTDCYIMPVTCKTYRVLIHARGQGNFLALSNMIAPFKQSTTLNVLKYHNNEFTFREPSKTLFTTKQL